jgi:catechol 2,3-dioxygenase-like lactoylglutathione lyase family enzyme
MVEMLGSHAVIVGADFDHVAVAVERWSDAWPRYIGQLGGTWIGGGPDPGFASAQLRYGNGMRLEVLEPHEPEKNDFLRRFLDRNGPGPHHFTFKVPDLAGALHEVRAAGLDPIGVNLDHPSWKEAFIHPKQAPGVVIQLAQTGPGSDTWGSPAPTDLPRPTPLAPASFDRVTLAVPDLDAGLCFFEDLLGGARLDAGEDDDARWVDLGWPGPGRVRLATPASSGSPLNAWLDSRRGRVHHIAFSLAGVDRRLEIAPQDNHGTRVLVAPG